MVQDFLDKSSINWMNCQIIQYMELWNYCTQVSLVDWSWWNFAFILRHNRILWSLLMPFCLSCLSVFLWTFGMLFFPIFFPWIPVVPFFLKKKILLFSAIFHVFRASFLQDPFLLCKGSGASPSIQFLTIGFRFSHWSMLQTYVLWTINS